MAQQYKSSIPGPSLAFQAISENSRQFLDSLINLDPTNRDYQRQLKYVERWRYFWSTKVSYDGAPIGGDFEGAKNFEYNLYNAPTAYGSQEEMP